MSSRFCFRDRNINFGLSPNALRNKNRRNTPKLRIVAIRDLGHVILPVKSSTRFRTFPLSFHLRGTVGRHFVYVAKQGPFSWPPVLISSTLEI